MIRKSFRLMRARWGVCPTGARAASTLAPGALAWLTLLLWGPACALALEIGEIQVNSALNQLFDARIPLPTLVPEELSKVSVKLAPAPIFKEFNLERVPALTSLVFSVEYNAEGEVYVKVVSTKPIQEPSLGLLVEFGWPRGKTFREFTVFLDPVRRLAQRPGDRSKTVLNAPAPPAQPAPPPVAAAPPTQPAPPPVAAPASDPEPNASPGDSANPQAVATIATKAVEAPAETPFPVEAASAPVRIYRPGDTYGPVAVGEGLWAIALKVRPDPAITRDQMTEALFKANRHAFGKTGISGLKSGSMLRIPSFQEIADLTGSTTARQLAGGEQQSAAAATPPPSPSPAAVATESPVSKPVASAPEVFPLELPPLLEPIMDVAALPALESVAPAAEPAVAKPEPVQPGSESVAAASESVALAAEPAAATPEPGIAESARTPVAVAGEPAQEVLLEPVSVTPLLFLAVSEMIATLAQPPAMTTVSEIETVTLEPKREAPAASESSALVSGIETPEPALTATLEPPAAPRNAIALLTPVEKYSPPLKEWDWLLQTYLAGDFSIPGVAEFTEPLPAPAMPAGTITAPSIASAEVRASVASESPQPPAVVDPGEPSPRVDEPSPHPYKGGDQYGPVAPKERLWDIAAKVRPDPAISKEHMMKALFKANPQAFSKPTNMDTLKVGATLRIPTLQEIVEHADSKAARRLLEQRQPAAMPAPAPEPVAPAFSVAETLSVPEPTSPAAETSPTALEPAAPATETPPVGGAPSAN